MEVKLKFNDINVKEEKEKTLVKVLMLKGEKGDTVSAEWGTITGNVTDQTDLKNALDSKANQTETTQALNTKANASDLNNYYTKSQIDTSLASKLGTEDIEDSLTSSSEDKVLSAKQGKLLKDELDENTSKTNKKPYYFNSISEMKSYNLQTGDMAITKGYYSANDGGAGEYEIVSDNSLVDDGGTIHALTNGLFAKLIIKNNTINIRQLGAKSLDTDLVKYDISSYINLYKGLTLNNKSTINLYIPSGIWFTSGNYFKNPDNCNIFGEGTFSYGGNMACGTIISSMSDNQDYLFQFGGSGKQLQQFNIHDLTFSSADFIYDSENKRFNYSNIKSITTAIKFELASYGTTNNLHFIYIKGECLSIKSSWEIFFGKLYFRFITNHNGCIMVFKQNIADWTNITACVFDYLMFESFQGDLIGLESHCALYNCHFNTINVEDREFIEDNEEYITITPEILENWDDDDYIHLSVFKLFEGCRANGNVINNIELNNFPKKIISWSDNNYIYDTIVNYNNDVTFSNIFNNIVSQGMNKNCCILRTEESYNGTNSQIPRFINLLNNSSFDYELVIKGLNDIYVSGDLKGVQSPTNTNKKDYIYSNYGNWIPCYASMCKYSTYKYIWSDKDTINKLYLCVTGNTSDTYQNNFMFTTILNPSKTIYLRAKIPNGEEAKIYLDDLTTVSGSRANYLTGTGDYKIYELTPNTSNANVGDVVGVRFGSNEQNRVLTRDVRLDSYISI